MIKETFHCVRLYQPDVEGGTVDIAESEMAWLIEKGMTHHLLPFDKEAKAMMPSLEDMTRGDLRALAEEKGVDYSGMKTEQIRAAVTPKKGAAKKQAAKELATMTLKELQALATDKGIDPEALAKELEVENPSKISKKQLIEAIQAAE
jgi:hypothetical protein